MDRKDLANLIFPNAKDISYYEEKYPRRNLEEGAIVTRFAPSPTGYVHIGGLYQCTISRKMANQTDGVFFLRIEDTDQKRELENATKGIVESLKEFNINLDEGMINENEWEGNYGPYKQSFRKEIYEAYAKYFLEQGKAYPCFATPEELDEMRAKQEAAKVRPGYYGVWAKYRDLPIDEAIERIKKGENYIVRFKSPGREDRKIRHQDLIKGKIDFPENDQDIVIIKGDGLPTYHFAHLVDDHLMGTTVVVRGDEWVSSIPLHLQLFQELGVKAPKYAHIAPLMKEDNGNKRKISKRKDPEAAVSYYSEIGVPYEAVTEYLLNIANSNFEAWRKGNRDKSVEEFELQFNKVGVSGALFDIVKLLDVSKTVISGYSAERVYEEAFAWAEKYDEELYEMLKENKEYSLKVLGIERGNAKPRKDIAKWSDLKDSIYYMYSDKYDKVEKKREFQTINDINKVKEILELYVSKYYDEADDKQTWFNKIKELAGSLGYASEVKDFKANPEKYEAHVGDVSTVIRIALTDRTNTPDMYEIMGVLGKDEVIRRLKQI